MPEISDIKVFAINLKKQILNDTVIKTIGYNPSKLNVSNEVIINKIANKKIVGIKNNGKEIIFHFEEDNSLGVHLMLLGEFQIISIDKIDKIPFKIFTLVFNKKALVLSDEKGLAKVSLNPELSHVPEAIDDANFSKEYFYMIIDKYKRKNIKALLIDQKIIRGIGNAYSDEILYEANISPLSKTGKIDSEHLEKLYDSISIVLNNAVKSILEVTPDRISGEERSFLKVHNKKISKTIKDEKIIIDKVASKQTYYTSNQKLFI